MQIDARLQAIAKFVPQGARLADIGTDHAYLPAFLLKEKKIAFAIAADVAAAPCKVAKTTLAMQGVSAVAQVRQGDGLKVLRPGECDTIVMAGMGG
ncbi:MAG: class I SAM-dependent methyltransferase, partial [Acidaminococcaceae bacterium]|nr:class I SAM-dependent methyltransferase [Acidaminococcaceae bacterium]